LPGVPNRPPSSLIATRNPRVNASCRWQLQIQPKARFGSYVAPTDNLMPSDIRYFGGKAANFGLLRRTIPSNSPPAIAFSLDLWDDFMSQQLVSGRILRDEIALRLKPYTNGNDIAGLKSALNGIRDLIRRDAIFTSEQRQIITNALRVFDPTKKIRFRSSTNVEDAESFTGAGLYDSFSGCLLDDLDNDTAGPCLCEAEEANERGVFRAIQRVYSSFYNDNAVLARLRFRLDENQAGMGILVHHSTPDEIELANGVATVTRREYAGLRDYQTDLVTQLGPTSVANPDTAAQPEVIMAYTANVTDFQIQQNSNLLPFGQQVLSWPEYRQLVENLFIPVTDAWRALYTNKPIFALDFEYKKIDPGFLQVKQVREIPLGDLNASDNAFLLKETVQRETHQGIGREALSTHRAKTRWTFTTRNLRLTETNVAAGLFESISFERNADGRIEQFSGAPSTLPNYHLWQTNAAVHSSWTMDTGDGPATFELTFGLYSFQRRAIEPLFLTLKDLPVALTITYSHTNLTRFEWWGEIEYGGTDPTDLDPVRQRAPSDVQFTHQLLITNQVNTNLIVKVNTSYWLDGPEIYTSYPRLVGNLTTRIEGLTAEPINLTGFFSQSFEGEHIVNSERFVFEPRIEPGISSTVVGELEAQDIEQIVVTHRFGIPRLRLLGKEHQLRDW
jgi:hypothetical protein